MRKPEARNKTACTKMNKVNFLDNNLLYLETFQWTTLGSERLIYYPRFLAVNRILKIILITLSSILRNFESFKTRLFLDREYCLKMINLTPSFYIKYFLGNLKNIDFASRYWTILINYRVDIDEAVQNSK